MCKRGLSSIEHHPQRKDYSSSFCVEGFSCKGEHKIMSKYEQMASEILAGVGGKENVTFVAHCMTRLRFNLKDQSKVKLDDIKKMSGVLGCQFSSGQFQVIIGQTVEHVYKEVCAQGGFTLSNSIEEPSEKIKEKLTLKKVGSNILETLSGCVVPLIPLMMAASMFKMLVAVLGPSMLNVLSETDDLYTLFTFVGDAGFYFFPIVLGYTASKKFNVTPVVGMFLGCIMMHPTFVNIATEGTPFTVYGIPCNAQNYASTLLPIILSIWVMSYIEKFFKRILPQALKTIFVPFLSIAVMIPICLCVLGPIGSILGNYICDFLLGLDQIPGIGFLAVAIIAALWEFVVMSGMHVVFITALVMTFAQAGQESLVSVGGAIASIAVAGMLLGSFLKIKNTEEKSLTFGYFIASIIGGVTEPGLYGNGIKYKRPFIGLIVGGFAGGLYAGITHVACYAMVPVASFIGLTAFAGGPVSNLINGVVSCGIAFLVAAVVTYFTGYAKDDPVLIK